MPKGGVLLANAALELAVAFGRRAGHEERRARRDVVVQAERVAAETESAGERDRDQRERARSAGRAKFERSRATLSLARAERERAGAGGRARARPHVFSETGVKR